MIEVRCQGKGCGSEIQVSDDTLRTGLLDGTIVAGAKGFSNICKRCQSAPNVGQDENVRPFSMAQESAAIQRIMDRVRDMNPDWSLEDAAHEAVERYNDVSKVRNQGFRAYLMERIPTEAIG